MPRLSFHEYTIGPKGYEGDVIWPRTNHPHLTIHFARPDADRPDDQGASLIVLLAWPHRAFASFGGYNEPADVTCRLSEYIEPFGPFGGAVGFTELVEAAEQFIADAKAPRVRPWRMTFRVDVGGLPLTVGHLSLDGVDVDQEAIVMGCARASATVMARTLEEATAKCKDITGIHRNTIQQEPTPSTGS